MHAIEIIIRILFLVISIFLLAGSLTSFFEKEFRAGFFFLLLMIPMLSVPFITGFLLHGTGWPEWILLVCTLLILLLFLLPLKGTAGLKVSAPSSRFDEADAVLSRRLLQPGTEEYNRYYTAHPEYRDPDDRARKKPGLLDPGSTYFDPGTFGAAEAGFFITGEMHALNDQPVTRPPAPVNPQHITRFIKEWLIRTGAQSVGFTAVQDYHLYSQKGRGKEKGKAIRNDLPNAVAITVEMDREMMKYAPAGPTVMESSEQYLRSAVLANKLAIFIRNLGYRARAHTDGNYEVICPLVAMDAGLGTMGRMGLLMTPRSGPRVRIAVVTTDLPLETVTSLPDKNVIDFCFHCKKCAAVCPSEAISFSGREVIDHAPRWKINSEKCYQYWTITGTDCGKCVIHCPFSHSDNWLHALVKRGIKNNLLFRRMAVNLDDIFYGRKPASGKVPGWCKIN